MPKIKENERGYKVGFEDKHEALGDGGGSTPGHFPQTPEEISKVNQVRALTKAYRKTKGEESKAVISNLIAQGMENLAFAEARGKMNLQDT